MDRDAEQLFAISNIRDELARNKIALLVACTGYGKGRLIKLIAHNVKTSLLVIAPKVNLVRDLAERTNGNIYCASLGKKEIGKITIATKQSIKDVEADLVILDEAHNYTKEFLESIKARFIIGLTATPFNENGYIYNQGFWSKPCYEFGIEKAINNKFLTRYEIFGSTHAFDVKEYLKGKGDYTESQINEMLKQDKHVSQVKEFINICNAKSRKKVAVLCANIEHAEKIYNEISKYEKCMIVHSKLKKSHELIEEYKNNNVRFIISVMMMSEGTDIPSIDCIIYLRPTKSTRLMVQSAGRGLRLHLGKEYCLLLDYGNVFVTCGTPHNPIIPSDFKKSQKEESTLRQCESCFYIYEKEIGTTCPSCGHVHKVERDVEKNLKQSIFVDDIETIIVDRSNIYRRSKTKKGIDFMTVKVNGKFHTFYSYQIKSVLSSISTTGRCKVYYKKEGSQKFKFIKAESYRDPQ